MNTAKLNSVKNEMLFRLNSKFPSKTPQSALDALNETLQIFPDIKYKENVWGGIELANVNLHNIAKNTMCFHTAESLINHIYEQYVSGELENGGTSIERKIWGLSEKQYSELISNLDLPTENRVEIMEIWKRKPDPEKEYQTALMNEETPLSERLELVYKYNEQESPEALKTREMERKERLADENVSLIDKINDLVVKTGGNEP